MLISKLMKIIYFKGYIQCIIDTNFINEIEVLMSKNLMKKIKDIIIFKKIRKITMKYLIMNVIKKKN